MIERLATFKFDAEDLCFRNAEALRDHLYSLEGVEVDHIGYARDRMDLFGIRFGQGQKNVSVIAGCHADEPIGPMTAQILSRYLTRFFPELLGQYRFSVVPQMNPLGAEKNRRWFADSPELWRYLRHALRELPGEDIEFGFGTGARVREECRATQAFLAKTTPYTAHFSLHGMAIAEGVWCLICQEWKERAVPYMDAFDALCDQLVYPRHDIERHGEKGFTRIRPGYCTTPTSTAMKKFFLDKNDRMMAGRFHPSSMEWAQSQGGDPICIVSELPLFTIGQRTSDLADPVAARLKGELGDARLLTGQAFLDEVARIRDAYALKTTPLELQVRLQIAMIVLALTTLADA